MGGVVFVELREEDEDPACERDGAEDAGEGFVGCEGGWCGGYGEGGGEGVGEGVGVVCHVWCVIFGLRCAL